VHCISGSPVDADADLRSAFLHRAKRRGADGTARRRVVHVFFVAFVCFVRRPQVAVFVTASSYRRIVVSWQPEGQP
jgi:hypothetical protein